MGESTLIRVAAIYHQSILSVCKKLLTRNAYVLQEAIVGDFSKFLDQFSMVFRGFVILCNIKIHFTLRMIIFFNFVFIIPLFTSPFIETSTVTYQVGLCGIVLFTKKD